MTDPSNKPPPKPFWKRQYDPLAKWRSGEFIEPDPVACKRHLLRGALILAAVVLIATSAKPWLHNWVVAYNASLGALKKTDPLAAAEKAALTIKWISWGQTILYVLVVLFVMLIPAIRELRAGRSPLPGKKVIHRTEIIRGPLLKWRSYSAIVVGTVLLGLCIYAGVTLHQTADQIQAESSQYLKQQKTGKTPAGHSTGQSDKLSSRFIAYLSE